ncbi:hypothetical protein ILUMI_20166 [Ignelater luminosus]|uniref:Reverse transcriptase domain-containing protein n=1 Tax=Ignelater luminosus TaxID=2038154 RepID=A0A8K0CIR0_IGNLU|nr:hypothetical protein ILUMI_20166 [Ignelater luminosus]
MFSKIVRSPDDPASNRRCCTSRVDSVEFATGHGKVDNWASHVKYTTRINQLRLATWNVRGLNQKRKLQIIQNELIHSKIDVASVTETHWHGRDHFKSSEYNMYYFGTEDGNIHGVDILVSNKFNNFVLGYKQINKRTMTLKLNARPCALNIIALCVLTLDAKDEEIKEFYRTVEVALLMCEFTGKLKSCRRRQLKRLPKLSAGHVTEFNDKAMRKLKPRFEELQVEDPEVIWQALKQSLVTTLKELPQGDQITFRQPWISAKTRHLITERRSIKARGLDSSINRELYQLLNREVHTATRRDKNLMNICSEIQNHALNNNSKDLFMKIRFIIQKFKPRHWTIKDQNCLATEPDKNASVWKDYCGNLYADPNATVGDLGDYEEEPDILLEEIQVAIDKLREGKAAGLDRISTEIWKTGLWPEDWSTSILLPLHKKGPKTVCDNYHLIALISHSSKIIQARLQAFLTHQIASEQATFVKGRGTREQILNARQLIEKARIYSVPIYLCFVDYEKAFDNVLWLKLWTTLGELGVPAHLITLVKNLYEASKAVVKIDTTLSEKCHIRKVVRQGCVLSLLLYNWNGGVKIGGRRFSNLRFADDTLLIAQNAKELLEFFRRLEEIS